MITLEQSNEIIKHRAAAASYDDIAELTGISKPTVIKVCKERENDILEVRKMAWANCQERIRGFIEERRQTYQDLLKEACSTICKRDVSKMTNKELLSLIRTLEQNLLGIEVTNKVRAKNKRPLQELTDEQLEEMLMMERASWAYQFPNKYPLNIDVPENQN